jgi:biotin carboxylase
MIDKSALIIHPSPNDELLESLLCVCRHLIVLSPKGYGDEQCKNLAQRVTRYHYTSSEDLIELAHRINDEHDIGVIPPMWEGSVESTSMICTALGFPGNPVSAARAARDKYLASIHFQHHNVPHPRTIQFEASTDDPSFIEDHIDYPFIVKIPQSTNSQSVTLVRSGDQLRAAIANIVSLYEIGQKRESNRLFLLYDTISKKQPFIAQEYIEGLELNIDLLYNETDHRVLGIFEKYPMVGPTFEEVQSIYPIKLDNQDIQSCIDTAAMAIRALGAVKGAAHVELKMTDNGPVIIESALRPGGFFTPQAIRYLTGCDPVIALVELLLTGKLPDIAPIPKNRACVYGAVNCSNPGQIVDIGGEDIVAAIPGISVFELLKRPGDQIIPLPTGTDYHIARFIITGNTRQDLEAAADKIRNSLEVVLK